MKKIILVFCTVFFVSVSFSQSVSQNLQKAWQQFESDSQLKHAISSLYVIDAKTGQVVFDKNSQIGLAPASTQKIITAATAFELLGKDYRYKTELGYTGKIVDKVLEEGNIYIKGSGDPTFGSWRYRNAKPEIILDQMIGSFQNAGIDSLAFNKISFKLIDKNFDKQSIPDGWIWQDIGNYYGAGCSQINWNENQYSISLKSNDTVNKPVRFTKGERGIYVPLTLHFKNEVFSAEKGSGDQAYIYYPTPFSESYIKGTIPVSEDSFVISGAVVYPEIIFSEHFEMRAYRDGKYAFNSMQSIYEKQDVNYKEIYTHYSPSLDSISYWFLKKSINLYGEALLKTFAYEKNGFGSTDGGVKIVKDFWMQKGIDEDELNISDGSGLSPQNRVTTHAQVEILKYAKSKDWFQYYLNGFPEYNGMTMKSGTIRDVKGFAGYHKAKDGKEYIFSFLVNNYNGRTSAVVNKMYKILDELK